MSAVKGSYTLQGNIYSERCHCVSVTYFKRPGPDTFLYVPFTCPLNLQMNNNGNKRAPTTATQRLKQDYLRIKKDPVPYICAEPLPSNILEW